MYSSQTPLVEAVNSTDYEERVTDCVAVTRSSVSTVYFCLLFDATSGLLYLYV